MARGRTIRRAGRSTSRRIRVCSGSRSGAHNCIASTSTVLVTKPDLVEAAVSNHPASIVRGGSFSVTDTVNNQGQFSAVASTTQYYLSTTKQKGSGAILIGSRAVPFLTAGATAQGTATVTTPKSTSVGTLLPACLRR
jgi:hypothetical protein